MRIVGGEWRGRQLTEIGNSPDEVHLRPSSDRFRETVFNIIRGEKYNHAPRNMRVLDLFAGTGALSFEALSRGAAHAVMVEQSAYSSAIIRKNVKRLDCKNRANVLKQSATQLGQCEIEPFDLVFLDPPYSQSLGEKAIDSALNGGWLKQDCVIIWEEEVAPMLPMPLVIQDQRQIGRAILTISRLKDKK